MHQQPTSPIQDMEKEHGNIKLLLRILEKVKIKLDDEETIPTDHLRKIITFIRIYADKCHHGKEEEILFPSFHSKGSSYEQELIAQLLEDHRSGRILVREIDNNIDEYGMGNSESREAIANNINKYVRLLNEHIAQENENLFPGATLFLTPEEQKQIMDQFVNFEQEKIGVGVHDALLGDLDFLKRAYLFPEKKDTMASDIARVR